MGTFLIILAFIILFLIFSIFVGWIIDILERKIEAEEKEKNRRG